MADNIMSTGEEEAADSRGTKRKEMEDQKDEEDVQHVDQPELKLYYFDIKGKGESIRLICAYSGLKLQDHRFESRDEFKAMKEGSRLPFGQVPMLEVDGKVAMVQSTAIMRYLGKLSGLYPMKDHVLAQKVDAVMDQATDVFTGSTVLTYGLRYAIDLSPEAKEKSFEHYNQTVLPDHLKRAERIVGSSATGWMAGTEEPSPADFVWYCSLTNMAAKKEISEKNKTLESFPKLKAFLEKFESLEAIKQYHNKEIEEENTVALRI
jgi:glutathione S-transferase